jgi:hypothetical protein
MTSKSNCYFQISGGYRLLELNMAKSSAKTPVGSLTGLNCRAGQCGQWEYSHSENPLLSHHGKRR